MWVWREESRPTLKLNLVCTVRATAKLNLVHGSEFPDWETGVTHNKNWIQEAWAMHGWFFHKLLVGVKQTFERVYYYKPAVIVGGILTTTSPLVHASAQSLIKMNTKKYIFGIAKMKTEMKTTTIYRNECMLICGIPTAFCFLLFGISPDVRACFAPWEKVGRKDKTVAVVVLFTLHRWKITKLDKFLILKVSFLDK